VFTEIDMPGRPSDRAADRNPQAAGAGPSAKEIAYELKLSPKTVDVHRAHIMERLEITDVANLTRFAIRHGLITA
jgi:DNA-binding NarL/FixJ family response regulator